MFAWTKWRLPLSAPTEAKLLSLRHALGPLGTGLSTSAGLGTRHGTIGLAAAGACLAAVLGLLLPGRLKLLASGGIAIASAGIFANGLTGFLSASHVQHGWSTAMNTIHLVQSGGINAALQSVSGILTKNSLAPAGGAAGAGALGFLGGIRSFKSSLRVMRVATRPPMIGMDMPRGLY